MRHLAQFFVRRRSLVGAMLFGFTLVASVGYVRTPADRERGADAREDGPPPRSAVNRVAGRLDLAGSDAFLVLDGPRLFAREGVTAIRQVVEAVESLPIVQRVLWADRVPNLNVFGIRDSLLPENSASEAAFQQAKQAVLDHPLAGQLVSSSGDALLMPIVYDWLETRSPDDEHQFTTEVVEAARAAIPLDLRQAIRVQLTGPVPLFAARRDAYDRNHFLFQVVGYLLALGIAAVLFRGVAAVGIVAAGPALSVYWSLGVARLIGLPSNPLADTVMPVLVSMIGLTDGVHLMTHIRRRLAVGDQPVAAAASAIERVGPACWLTSLTTAIGFAALFTAESHYVQEFGQRCCLGVLVAFVAVVFSIPFFASGRLGSLVSANADQTLSTGDQRFFKHFISRTLNHRWAVAATGVTLTTILLLVALTLRPDRRLRDALPSSSSASESLVFCDEKFGGIRFFRVEMQWPNPSEATKGPRHDDLLRALADAEKAVLDEALLAKPLSVLQMLASFPGDPNDFETKATLLSLMPQQLRGFFFNPVERSAVISVRVQDRGLAVYTPVFDRLEERLGEVARQYDGVTFALRGSPVEGARDLHQVVDDLRTSLGSASVIIFVVLTVAYRSLGVGVVSIIPNLFPLAVTGTLLAMTGSGLDLPAACAFVVCLGIAVDDTIHFLSRFQQEYRAGVGHVDQAVRNAFVDVAWPMLVTTAILVVGFMSMLLSDLPAHRTFAAMACSTVATAALGDLAVLPALLALRGRRSGVQRRNTVKN